MRNPWIEIKYWFLSVADDENVFDGRSFIFFLYQTLDEWCIFFNMHINLMLQLNYWEITTGEKSRRDAIWVMCAHTHMRVVCRNEGRKIRICENKKKKCLDFSNVGKKCYFCIKMGKRKRIYIREKSNEFTLRDCRGFVNMERYFVS